MQQRTLGKNLKVSAIGYGAMGLSGVYGKTDDATSVKLLQSAVDLGINFFDTADVYGAGHNETLFAQAFQKNREKVIIATKTALKFVGSPPKELVINNHPDYIRTTCDASLKRLGTDYIDLYYLHRIDPKVAIEESMAALVELVNAGKIRHIGLSEAHPDTIRRAHAVHPVAAIQSEYSLWSRDIEYNDVLKTCNELNIGVVPYSPLGRGFLTGALKDKTEYESADFRPLLPRFSGENLAHNTQLVEQLEAFAADKKVTAAQIALAWVLSKGDHIVPIPGTTKIERLKQNVAAASIDLTCDDMEYLDALFAIDNIKGARLPEALMNTVYK
jgi:aryl-alcohol dehydrogenase-like predicted oxidoreductase